MKIQVFGHPYSSIGMGEQMVSFCRALDEVYIDYRIYNIHGAVAQLSSSEQKRLQDMEEEQCNWGDTRIFHINGDEVEMCMEILRQRGFDFDAGRNIIIPAWELSSYPDKWRNAINRFDEVWVQSKFIEKIFSADWVKPKIKYVGQAAERGKGLVYSRKFFSINDSSLVFLSFFDQSSYVARKNPYGVLELYNKLREALPYGDFQLVLKIKNINSKSEFDFELPDDHVVLINENLDSDKMTSLLDCCDVFVSLHRSEGFGRGAAEAVLRGKRAMVTGYSGVEDYCYDSAVIPVKYTLVDVDQGNIRMVLVRNGRSRI